jgi:hypothetical protein
MSVPVPTRILRFIHIDNLSIVMRRGGHYAPNFTPRDGLSYRTIHDSDVQRKRSDKTIAIGPGGVIHDYVPFYFGYLSPMMLNLKTRRVPGYSEGQEPLIYLASSAQAVAASGIRFVFSDGHGLAAYTSWYDDLAHLGKIDWDLVNRRYWADDENNPDRQRRKQAEFLVHRFCPWSLVQEIGVIDEVRKSKVEQVLSGFPDETHRPIRVRRDWYYP